MPVRPMARPPCWLIRLTMSLLTRPPSTISTTSMVSRSVTRMPCTNSPFLPTRFSMSSICGPPPWTTTGFMPTSFSNTTSRAKECLQLLVGHGVAAVLDDDGLAVEAADIRQRFGEDLRLRSLHRWRKGPWWGRLEPDDVRKFGEDGFYRVFFFPQPGACRTWDDSAATVGERPPYCRISIGAHLIRNRPDGLAPLPAPEFSCVCRRS